MSPERPEVVADDDFASYWDELALWAAPFGLLLLDRVPLRRGITVLDVGAGTGFSTIELAQRCGDTSRVIAVDPWASGVERLRKKISYLGLHNVQLLEQDAEDVDIGDATIDLVVSNLGVNNFEDPVAVFATCRRVLRPNGYLAVTTNFSGHMTEFYLVLERVMGDAGLADLLPDLEHHVAHRGTLLELTEALGNAGFDVVDHHAESFRLRYADGTAFLQHRFIKTAFLPAWLEVLPDDQADDLMKTLESELNATAEREGEFAVTIPVDYIGARPR